MDEAWIWHFLLELTVRMKVCHTKSEIQNLGYITRLVRKHTGRYYEPVAEWLSAAGILLSRMDTKRAQLNFSKLALRGSFFVMYKFQAIRFFNLYLPFYLQASITYIIYVYKDFYCFTVSPVPLSVSPHRRRTSRSISFSIKRVGSIFSSKRTPTSISGTRGYIMTSPRRFSVNRFS